MSIFRQDFSTPTDEQFALLGRIITEWAIIENLFASVLARLAGAPDFTTLTLVEKLGLRSQLEAAKLLLEMHESRYRFSVLDRETVATGRAILREMDRLKDDRDYAAHAVWTRYGDELIGTKLVGRQWTPERDKALNRVVDVDDLKLQTSELAPLVEKLEAFLSLLPATPEAPERSR